MRCRRSRLRGFERGFLSSMLFGVAVEAVRVRVDGSRIIHRVLAMDKHQSRARTIASCVWKFFVVSLEPRKRA